MALDRQRDVCRHRLLLPAVHGNTTYATCLDCGERYELAWVRKKFEAAGSRAPDCDCGGYIKTATVSFGQAMPAEAMAIQAETTTVRAQYPKADQVNAA